MENWTNSKKKCTKCRVLVSYCCGCMYVISMLYVTIASNAIKINSNFPKMCVRNKESICDAYFYLILFLSLWLDFSIGSNMFCSQPLG